MKTARSILLMLVPIIAGTMAVTAIAADDDAFQQMTRYQYGQDLRPLLAVERLVEKSLGDPQQRKELAARLVAAMAGPETTLPAKQFIGRQLQVCGTEAEVPALAKMLTDPQVGDWARGALEMIPGDVVGAALRSSLDKLQGNALVGVINSLGNRGDGMSVAQLKKLAGGEDAEVAGAALWALGKIGVPDVIGAFAAALKRAPADKKVMFAAAYLRAADKLWAEGKLLEPATMYSEMVDQPRSIRRAAFDGTLRLSPPKPQVVQVVLAILAAEGDPDAWQVAAAELQRFTGQAATAELVDGLPKLPPAGRIILLENLAERGVKAALPAAVAAAKSKDASLQAAGVRCLADLGDASVVPLLLECAAAADPRVSEAARESLTLLPGSDTEEALLAALGSAEGKQREMLTAVLAARKSTVAVPALLTEAAARDPEDYRRALRALRILAEPQHVTALIDLLMKAHDDAHREEIERAVMLVCNRSADADRRAEPILERFAKATPAERCLLLPVLGRIGGAKALEAVRAAMKSDDRKLREAGVRGLCNWPDAIVAGELLDLAKTAPAGAQRIAGLRAYIRVISLKSDRPEAETFALLTGAMKLASRDEERRLILSRMSAVRTMESLRWLLPYLDNPTLAQEACQAVVELAHHRFLTRPNKDEFAAALKKVIEVSKDPQLIEQAKGYLAGL